ncbi:MAG: phytochelatin synthase family protein [Legionellaceae bacterium]|nr:phytochelatin synthase family protein [Legionellaceae bacterium]
MKFKYLLSFWFLLALSAPMVHSVEPIAKDLIGFNSKHGKIIFQRSLNHNELKLLAHFTTQKTGTYCGIASAVMILNAAETPAPFDSQHPPYHYFNQDDFFNAPVTQIITLEKIQKAGIPLKELAEVIQDYGLKTQVYYASDLNLELFRSLLRKAISNQHFIIVNFLRTSLGQEGSGHHSPVAAYDTITDRFLILDVARYKYPAYWVKAANLWNAVNTKDKTRYRGFLVSSVDVHIGHKGYTA